MSFLIEHRCENCGKSVTEHERCYASCCPHCGHLPDDTFLNTTRHAYQLQTVEVHNNPKWWQFWIPKVKKIKVRVYQQEFEQHYLELFPNAKFGDTFVAMECTCEYGGGPTHWAAIRNTPDAIEEHLEHEKILASLRNSPAILPSE